MIGMLIVVFDVETKKAFDEVGGYHPEKLGVSLAGVWVGESRETGELKAYKEDKLSELFRILEKADVVVGFNSIDFDYPALSQYYSGDLDSLPSMDMLRRVDESLGYRVKLDSLIKETLGIQKAGSGLDAIKYYHAGDWDSLEKYCLQDVEVTKDLYFYGLEHGKLRFKNKWNELVNVEVDFTLPTEEEKKVQTTMF